MPRINKTVGFLVIAIAAIAVTALAVWKLHTHIPPASTSNVETKMYINKDFGISTTYPSTVTVHERTDQDGYLEVAFDDTATQACYLFVRSYSKQSDIENVSDFFTGPYPKQVSISGNAPAQTAIERTMSGMEGVEVYGGGPEGNGYNDQFFYRVGNRIWIISLNPVIEGHATLDDIEPGTPAPTESYKQTYEEILETMIMWDTNIPDTKTAVAQLQADLKTVTPHFIVPTLQQQQTLTASEQKIADDVASVFNGQYVVEHPTTPPVTYASGSDFWVDAIGARYILITSGGADKTNDEILDSQTGKITGIPGIIPVYLPNAHVALNVDSQAIYSYSLDQASATLVANSQLSGTETYNDGIGELGPPIAVKETHTSNSITISIFDSSKVIPNPDGGTMYTKVRDVTFKF